METKEKLIKAFTSLMIEKNLMIYIVCIYIFLIFVYTFVYTL